MERERAERLRRATEPAWDELREQRLLSRIVAETGRGAVQARPRSKRVWYVLLAAAAAVLLGVFALPRLRSTTVATPAPVTPASADGAKLTLVDGSVASLRADAQVRVDEQSPRKVELTQLGGQVHYDVTHDVTRPFRVHVGNVIVSVHGTRFVVTASADAVEVRVEQGVVGVNDGAREREVSAGETLIVPARLGVVTPPADASDSIAPIVGAASAPKTAAVANDAPVTAATLLARADEARLRGNIGDAAVALRQMLAQFPGDPRIPSAAFTLGKLERRLGRPADSARAFARCRTAAPSGALAMDALAEEALAWSAAGQTKAAHDAAQRYLAANPSGAYAARMSPLVGGAN